MKSPAIRGPVRTGLLRPTSTALLALSCIGCSATARPLPDMAEEINATLQLNPYVVREGDVLEVRFFRKAEWNFSTRVRQDGRASFTGIDEQQVAGLSIQQVDDLLTGAYADQPEQPEITVDFATISEDTAVTPRGVMVIGEVVNPGAIAVRGESLNLVEAIARAGGHDKRTANLRNTLLVRWLRNEQRRVSWRLDASVEYWGSAVPIQLQPNDIVFVPNTAIDEVDIWVDQYIRQLIPFGMAIPVPVE